MGSCGDEAENFAVMMERINTLALKFAGTTFDKEGNLERQCWEPLVDRVNEMNLELKDIESKHPKFKEMFEKYDEVEEALDVTSVGKALPSEAKLSVLGLSKPAIDNTAAQLQDMQKLEPYINSKELANTPQLASTLHPLESVQVDQKEQLEVLEASTREMLVAYNEIIHIVSQKFLFWDHTLAQHELAVKAALERKHGLSPEAARAKAAADARAIELANARRERERARETARAKRQEAEARNLAAASAKAEEAKKAAEGKLVKEREEAERAAAAARQQNEEQAEVAATRQLEEEEEVRRKAEDLARVQKLIEDTDSDEELIHTPPRPPRGASPGRATPPRTFPAPTNIEALLASDDDDDDDDIAVAVSPALEALLAETDSSEDDVPVAVLEGAAPDVDLVDLDLDLSISS